ncbi:MAG: MBL fold metallo-hydrolase [Syntrophaceae bacterium]|nr:MBL fold metallo-hydrolase [Syntrophaceae bacterium]
MLKRSLIFWMAGLAFYSLGIMNPIFSESNDFKNHLITMTILYDNHPYDHRLKTAWGFSCVIEFEGKKILFDTGGDGRTLLENMKILNKDPKTINTIILSHIHGDHTGGLGSLLREKSNVKIYIPGSFSQEFDRAAKVYGVTVVRVNAPSEIYPGFHSTGEMGHGIKEQSLLVDTAKGMVLITGCAHPGIVEIIQQAKTIARKDIYMAIGGWHLSSAGEREIKGIIEAFLKVGIQKVGPCHCTGDLAMAMFKDAYGKNFIQAGVGKIIQIEGLM